MLSVELERYCGKLAGTSYFNMDLTSNQYFFTIFPSRRNFLPSINFRNIPAVFL